jgi:hypothetical protein
MTALCALPPSTGLMPTAANRPNEAPRVLCLHKSSRPCGNSETWALSGARSGRYGISAAFAPLAV